MSPNCLEGFQVRAELYRVCFGRYAVLVTNNLQTSHI